MLTKVYYTVEINATKHHVYTIMLSPQGYTQWTHAFNPNSVYTGSWDQGSQIAFGGTDEQGNMGGIASRIAVNRPAEFVSIEHIKMFTGGIDVNEDFGPSQMPGVFENYSFTEKNSICTVNVELEIEADWKEYFDNKWPLALQLLKEICEKQ